MMRCSSFAYVANIWSNDCLAESQNLLAFDNVGNPLVSQCRRCYTCVESFVLALSTNTKRGKIKFAILLVWDRIAAPWYTTVTFEKFFTNCSPVIHLTITTFYYH